MTRVARFVRSALCAAVIFGMLLTQGCSLFVSKHQAVTIRSSDPQGEISVDGVPAGTGSVAMKLDRRKPHTVTVRAPGGKTGAGSFNKKISAAGVLDIVGGIFLLVPFLGLLGPGFWELEPDEMNVVVH
jgi:hypothetical protein